jgi:hypothetical protein
VGSRVGLNTYEKFRSHQGSIPGPSRAYPDAIQTEIPQPQFLLSYEDKSQLSKYLCVELINDKGKSRPRTGHDFAEDE